MVDGRSLVNLSPFPVSTSPDINLLFLLPIYWKIISTPIYGEIINIWRSRRQAARDSGEEENSNRLSRKRDNAEDLPAITNDFLFHRPLSLAISLSLSRYLISE